MAFRAGRTIGERREKLETKNERNAARKKDKQRQLRRVMLASFGFCALFVALVLLALSFTDGHDPLVTEGDTNLLAPTVEIIDEDATTGSHITNRMYEYIGQAERDFRDLGYQPIKVVVPTGTIREVDFYLAEHPGFIKLHIDRPTAVSVEDADRLLRYLAEQGITEYEYLDVRLSGRAYWK